MKLVTLGELKFYHRNCTHAYQCIADNVRETSSIHGLTPQSESISASTDGGCRGC